MKKEKEDVDKQIFFQTSHGDNGRVEFHHERIKCPECNRFQKAKVEHTFPWHSYVHECVCGYIIMESEWNHVPFKKKNK